MMIEMTGPLLLVGAGKMGGAMLAGWLKQGADPELIAVQDPAPSPELEDMAARSGFSISASPECARPPSVIVLAVKPQIMDAVLPTLKNTVGEGAVVLSIAAGKTIADIARHLGGQTAIIRAMPNTPAAIGRGMTVAVPNQFATGDQRRRCAQLLAAVGEVEWVADEALMDAVTAVSGSGPAYVFLLAECLAEAGVKAGLSPELAARLAQVTVSGAGELMRRSDIDPAELRRNVTSPGGTTQAALKILRAEPGLRDLMIDAVKAAATRSRELSS